MISFRDLLRGPLTLLGNNLGLFTTLALALFIVNAAFAFIPVPASLNPAEFLRMALPLQIVALVVASFVELALTRAFYDLFAKREVSPRATLSLALKTLPAFFVIRILWGILMFVGLIFLFVPAIIFAIWFMFLGAVVMIEGKRGLSAFKASRALTAPYFLPLLWRTALSHAILVFLLVAALRGFSVLIAFALAPKLAGTLSALFSALLSTLFIVVSTGIIMALYREVKTPKR